MSSAIEARRAADRLRLNGNRFRRLERVPPCENWEVLPFLQPERLAAKTAFIKLAPWREGKLGGWLCGKSSVEALRSSSRYWLDWLGDSTAVVGEEDLPIAGTYAKDRVCRGDGSDPADLLVKITGKAI